MKNKLLAHLRTHYGLKPYKCHFCSKPFNDKGNLKTHLRVHTGERPYKCSICFKTFKTEGQIREHLGSHYKDKPFQCPYCLKNYKRKGVVKNHILIHYKDPLFIEKKDLYEKLVDNLDNKNYISLYDSSGNKINTGIFSTKGEYQNKNYIFPKVKSNDTSIKESTLNSELQNKSNIYTNSEENNNNKTQLNVNNESNEDEQEDESESKDVNIINYDNYFYSLLKKQEEQKDNNDNNIDNDNEEFLENQYMEENSSYFEEIKNESKNNYLLFEEIL